MLRYLLYLVISMLPVVVRAQILHNPVPASYNADLQRILLINSGNTLYVMCQGQLDKDSAYYFCTQVYGLSRLLPYNDEYAMGKDYPGNQLISTGAITQAVQLVPKLNGNSQLQLQAELANYYLHKPGTLATDMDSALQFTQSLQQQSFTAKNTFWQIKALQLLGNIYNQQNNHEKAHDNYQQAVTLSRQASNLKQLATSLLYQAQNMPTGHPQKQSLLQEAMQITIQQHLPYLQYQVSNECIIDHFRNTPAIVEKEIINFIAFEKTLGFIHHQYAYNTLSYLSLTKGDVVNCRKYAEQAVQAATNSHDTAFSSTFCMRMCTAFIQANDLEAARYWNKRALSIPLTRETHMMWYKCLMDQIRIHLKGNNFPAALQVVKHVEQQYPPVNPFEKMILTFLKGNCYDGLDSIQEAKKIYEQYLQMANTYPSQFLYVETLGAYGFAARLYFKTGQYKEARYYSMKILNDPVGKMSVPDQAKAHEILFRLDSAAGNPYSAIQHLQTLRLLSDSIYSITQKKQFAELAVQYETQKKDQNIQLLTQKSQLQKEQLTRSAQLGKFTLAGIALLLIILALLYNQYRLKQKAGKEAMDRNELLQKVVAEKEWLLKEIHHRVKNNLQTVVSLLESQASYLQSKEAQIALQDSQNRIYAMSLIHQLLYHDENVASINMGTYLPELVQYLNDSFGNARQMRFQLTVDPFHLDVSQAVPLGLILNEAITNSIKYAFPTHAANNTIRIQLQQNEAGKVRMEVADNGKGLPDHFNPDQSTGLGILLMKGLTEDLEGAFTMQSQQGVCIHITFNANHLLSGPLASITPQTATA